MIQASMPAKTSDEWVAAFNELGLMCAKVNDYDDILNDEHCNAVESFSWVDQPGVGEIPVINPPGIAPLGAEDSRGLAPNIGEHSHTVLSELGYGEEEIAAFENRTPTSFTPHRSNS